MHHLLNVSQKLMEQQKLCEDLDLVMPIYILKEYSSKHSEKKNRKFMVLLRWNNWF